MHVIIFENNKLLFFFYPLVYWIFFFLSSAVCLKALAVDSSVHIIFFGKPARKDDSPYLTIYYLQS